MRRCITVSLHKNFEKERTIRMNAKEKIRLLENRLHKLSVKGKDNYGARQKIEREIRKLKKEAGIV